MTQRRPLAIVNGASAELPHGDQLVLDILDFPAGYIDGLKMVWVSGTALTVTTGSAYIPGLGKVLRVTSDIAKTGLSLTASTWYHVYLYSNAGTPDVELSTTAPDAPYNGTARSKTGDSSRRYVGSVRTTSGGAIIQFQHNPRSGAVTYLGADYTLRNMLSSGNATTATTVSCASIIPVTAVAVDFLLTNISNQVCITSASTAGLPLGTGAGHSYFGYANPSNGVAVPGHPVDGSQALTYMLLAASTTGGAYIDLNAYSYGR